MTTGRGGRQRIPRPPTFTVGGPPPWAELDPARRRLSLADVRARLADIPPARPPHATAPGARDAAVLVPIFEEGGEARIVLTKRPETMLSHQGEIAFPGGKVEPAVDADARAAALREAEEEIALAPGLVDVVAELDAIGTVASRFVIRPFVGIVDGRPSLTPHPYEVVSVFDVAISELLDPEAYREEVWNVDVLAEARIPPDFNRSVLFFELPGETVWGATGRILANLLRTLTGS